MRVLGKSVYRGPHLHGDTPMIRIELDLGLLEQWPTNKIPRFSEALLALLPGLGLHGCSYGTSGGFVRRLSEGTWLGHVAEHVTLELQALAGMPLTFGRTRSVKGKPGIYNIMYEYEAEEAGLWAGRLALELVSSLLPEGLSGAAGLDLLIGDGQPAFSSVEDAVRRLRIAARGEKIGPTTRAIMDAAISRKIPVLRIDGDSLMQLGWGKNQKRFCASMKQATSQVAVDVACDKALTKKLLAEAGIPVPRGSVETTVEGALRAAGEIGYPVVIKPLDGNHGRGVTTNIMTEDQVRQAFAQASLHARKVVVEQHYAGRDYRVLVVNGQIAAVAERTPAHITGDGVHTVAELVGLLNADPLRGDGHEEALSKVVVDVHVENLLARDGLFAGSVLAPGQKVRLCDSANLSSGGTAIDRTDDIHPANALLMERAARTVGLDISGIDVVTGDISLPLREGGGGVVEVNAAPGLRMHLRPSQGRPRPVGEAIVSALFPEGAESRIPIAAITGTNGKSTTTRMVAHILRQGCRRVGFTSTSGIYVGDEALWEGDASGPQSARWLLRDPTVDAAVLETARGGILREGLAFDYCDVGAVLNIGEDHLGLGGIDTLDDLAAVKAVVVECVGRKGVSVLNADDPLTRDMARSAGGRVCFFSMHGRQAMAPWLRAHIEDGGLAVVREGWPDQDEIVIYAGGRRLPVIGVGHIPATFGGIAGFNIQNALAAAAIAFGMGEKVETIRSGLSVFTSSFEQNPGRLNVHDGHGFRVIMDYAHNPPALSALLELTGHMGRNHGSVIGAVSAPGDRRDEDIREIGRLAAQGFDFLVFREDEDMRGRPEGEVLRLLSEGARDAGFLEENLLCVRPEEEAVDICLRRASPGDLVVLIPTDVKRCWRQMLSFTPAPPSFYQVSNTGTEARYG